MAEIESIASQAGLQMAYENSYYFIAGCGGDLAEWVTGYEGMLAEEGIAKPRRWFQTSGAAVNRYAGDVPSPSDYFQEDLVILMFPLDGMDGGKLALFKIRAQDRWFDDVIDNMRRPV